MEHRDNQINTTLSLEEQNHLLLQETLKLTRKIHRIYVTQLIITIVCFVLPIIGAAVFLPSIVRSFAGTLEQLTNVQRDGGSEEEIQSILNSLQGK